MAQVPSSSGPSVTTNTQLGVPVLDQFCAGQATQQPVVKPQADTATGPRPMGPGPELDVLMLDSPRSVNSFLPGVIVAENMRKADALTHRIDEVLVRITSQVDDALAELGAEVPQLWQENYSRKAGLERISESQASCLARIDALERALQEETVARRELEGLLDVQHAVNAEKRADVEQISQVQSCLARIDALERNRCEDGASERRVDRTDGLWHAGEATALDELRSSVATQLAALEHGLAQEREARLECEEFQKGQAECGARGALATACQAAEEAVAQCRSVIDSAESKLRLLEGLTDGRAACPQPDIGARVECLERGLQEETSARYESDKALGKDLCEQVALEIERMHEAVLREMRERMDGQRTLREELHVQQQALMRVSPRIDDAFIELQTELPRLSQELAEQKAELEKFAELLDATTARAEAIAKGLADECDVRGESDRVFCRELRQEAAAEAGRVENRLGAVQRLSEELRVHVDATSSDVRSARELVEHLARDAAEVRDALEHLGGQLQLQRDHCLLQSSDVDKKIGTMQGWVETAVVQRINALDFALRREMTERSMVIKQVLDAGSHNSERWCQMQAKFDELLIEVHRVSCGGTGTAAAVAAGAAAAAAAGAAAGRAAGAGIDRVQSGRDLQKDSQHNSPISMLDIASPRTAVCGGLTL